MLETDAPYLLPRDLAAAAEVAPQRARLPAAHRATVAALRGESLAELAEATTQNAVRFFGLPEP